MGAEWKVLAEKLAQKNKKVSVNDDTNLARSLTELAEDISYYSRGKNKQIDKKVLLDAFNLELSDVFTDDNLFQEIFSLNNKLAKWIYSGSEVIEKWKFTEVNYEFKRQYANGPLQEYKPIIPVPFDTVKKDYSGKDNNTAQNKGFENVLNFVNNFDSILFNAQTLTAVLTPTNPIDDLIVLGLRAYYQAKLPDSIKQIFDKIKSVVNQIKNFINDVVREKINENVALLNAFLCGLINGLISLLQMVILLLGFVVDNIPLLEAEKAFSREAIDKRDKQFEFIEDVLDTITENVSGLFVGLIKTFVNLPKDFVKFVKELTVKLKNKSQYFFAFIIGAIGFELILDAIIAFFTGGTSLAVSFANKISRATTKATQAGIKAAKQVGKKVVTSVDDIYKFLKKEIEEFVQAIKDGKVIDWLREKLFKLFGVGKKVELKLRGEIITLKNLKFKPLRYTKRTKLATTKLRNKFNSSIRKNFVKDLMKKTGIQAKLKKSGVSDDMIKLMKENGRVPAGWQVHHKLPLDDGGTNSFRNLVLIKNEPYHKAITAYQKTVTKGLTEGKTRNIDWPTFNNYIDIYP